MGLTQSTLERENKGVNKGNENEKFCSLSSIFTTGYSSDETATRGVTFQVNDVEIGDMNKPDMKDQCLLRHLDLVDPGAYSEHQSTKKIVALERGRGVGHIGIDALLLAFNEHLPLSLRPDFFWFLILQGVDLHVSKNAEKLRDNFVSFEGKRVLSICRNEIQPGNPSNRWDSVIRDFVVQIKANAKEGVVDKIINDFSTSTYNDVIASAVTSMSFTKHFFEFEGETCCGFPSITLEGNKEDWEHLITKTHNLLTLCEKEFAFYWEKVLFSVLNKFVKQFENPSTVDVKFWDCMIIKDGAQGSGVSNWISGWINAFIPYKNYTGGLNEHCFPYHESIDYRRREGLDIAEIPEFLISAPVKWSFFGLEKKLTFVSGFIGIEQEIDTGVIKPLIGWYIVNGDSQKSNRPSCVCDKTRSSPIAMPIYSSSASSSDSDDRIV